MKASFRISVDESDAESGNAPPTTIKANTKCSFDKVASNFAPVIYCRRAVLTRGKSLRRKSLSLAQGGQLICIDAPPRGPLTRGSPLNDNYRKAGAHNDKSAGTVSRQR